MVLVEINQREVQALDELYADAKCPIPMGLVLGLLRTKIQEAFVKEQETLLKGKYGTEKKSK